MTELPCFSFFPALRLAKPIDLGEWRVGGATDNVSWRNERFKELVQKLLASVATVGFSDPAILFHARDGLSGVAPNVEEADAIQAAVRFAVLDANDHVIDSLNAGLYLATSENAELYVQPIDEEHGSITHRTGGVLRKQLAGGWKIGDAPPPMPDAVLKLDRPVHASRSLAQAVFRAVTDSSSEANRRLSIAIEWHGAAMANPRAVTAQQRLIGLKTGFEALLRESRSRECAKLLRKHFETATTGHWGKLPWAGLLWSPAERTDLCRPGWRDGEVDVRSEIEDWFMALALVRNEIIHEGRLSTQEYAAPAERPLSRYAGPLFWKAERLLREAIKGALGADVLLCGRITEHKRSEEFGRMLLEAFSAEESSDGAQGTNKAGVDDDDDGDDDDESRPQGPPPPARPLPELLAELGCPGANHVLLRKATGGSSHSLKVAQQMERDARDKWIAIAGPRSMLIQASEYEILLAAGAEHELSDWIEHCD